MKDLRIILSATLTGLIFSMPIWLLALLIHFIVVPIDAWTTLWQMFFIIPGAMWFSLWFILHLIGQASDQTSKQEAELAKAKQVSQMVLVCFEEGEGISASDGHDIWEKAKEVME